MARSSFGVILSGALAVALVGCGDDADGGDGSEGGLDPAEGTPLDGDGAGTYGDRAFAPAYAIAKDRGVGGVVQELQFSEVPINCEHHLTGGAGNDLGLYFRVFLESLEPGTYEDVFMEWAELHDTGTRQRGTSGGTIELTAVDADSIAGTIQYEADAKDVGTVSFDGSFEMIRCGDVD